MAFSGVGDFWLSPGQNLVSNGWNWDKADHGAQYFSANPTTLDSLVEMLSQFKGRDGEGGVFYGFTVKNGFVDKWIHFDIEGGGFR